jgi:pimeloyl-ACP methyl ester carboxylesterase
VELPATRLKKAIEMGHHARTLGIALLVALAACSTPTPRPSATGSGAGLHMNSARYETPLACSALRSMRGLHNGLKISTNPKTGDSVEYAVVGDGAKSDDVIVFFPGTGQTIADWPIQMITNRTASPGIARAAGYRATQDGSISLCHEYRLVFFDYPGVGLTTYRANATYDAIASDVDAMLQQIGAHFGISTSTVDPLGWSLGTTMALKYAFLSPVSRPARTIRNVLLLAAGPGGSMQGQVGGNSAGCVQTLLNAEETATGSIQRKIAIDATQLIFPYRGQTASQNGSKSGCTANVSERGVTLSVKPNCTILSGCTGYIVAGLLGLYTDPWKRTAGVSGKPYALQRSWSNDFDVAYCSTASRNFTSSGCTAYGTVKQSITNGAVCKTDTSNPDAPTSTSCDAFAIKGMFTVIFGHEDLFTQWTYDESLVDALNAKKSGSAKGVLYPGSAGHGLLIQEPRWVQAQLAAAMQ